jgi:aminopeptidase-like protein/aminoglycoside N3'-acetyltransferase
MTSTRPDTLSDATRLDAAGDYGREDLVAAFRGVGLGENDLVYFQICADPLGVPRGCESDEDLCAMLWSALREVVGDGGTIVVPTYSFSFCRQEEFDVDESPTVSGLWNDFPQFPEYVRRLPGAIRSADPIFSNAGVGPRAAELLSDLPHACLGEDCVHDRFRRAGGKICILGVGLYEAIFRHYVESVKRVPWRYDKLFTGYVREGDERRKEGWIYNVRIRAKNGDPDGHALEALARERGVCRAAPVGAGEVVAVDCAEYWELTVAELARDPWYTAAGPAGDPVALESARIGTRPTSVELPADASMMQMLDSLWKLPRDIVSDGYDDALRALATQHPMTIHEYPTGTECWSWIVPERWSCDEAWLETMDGRRIFSIDDHRLHVVSYSLPFEGEVSRETLLEHLHVHPTLPDAVPFIFKYYDRDWGLCCTREQRDALTDERYRVVIRSSFSYGTLKVGEVVVPGESEECIVLCAHLCHPQMANDDLSGVVVGLDVMRALAKEKKPRYTYRFIIVPETIGSVAYLAGHEALIPSMKGGLFIEMLGKPQPHALQHSFAGTAEVDLCFGAALRARDPEGHEGAFRTLIGNDEKQFNGPGVRVPMLSLSRVLRPTEREYPYREYHSSFDTPAIISERALEESRDMVLAMIHTLEANRTPRNLFRGEVFCARYGIHIDWYTNPEGHRELFAIMDLIDGTRSIAEIADRCSISFEAVRAVVDVLRQHDLVE